MAELLKQRPVKLSRELPADLDFIAKAGWMVGPRGALLLRPKGRPLWMLLPLGEKRRRLKELWGNPWRILWYWDIPHLLDTLKGKRRRRNDIDPSELGSYEFDYNEVYGSLDDLRAEPSTYLHNAAIRGLSFAVRMLEDATPLPCADSLIAVVRVFVDEDDEDFFLQGVDIRFFTPRGDYPIWLDDLEGFRYEAIAVLDMNDLSDDGVIAV